MKKKKKILINVKLPCSIESKQTKYLLQQNYNGKDESYEDENNNQKNISDYI